uniref:E3 ubiquitin-protein ligase n=1 Tax=Panagrolaimus sp. JU765 TaxID=591449 RepID=A0AC34RGN9_9BILA
MAELVGQYDYKGSIIKFYKSDITEIRTDVVLVSSDVGFSMSVGAAAALRHAGGSYFEEQLDRAKDVHGGERILSINCPGIGNLRCKKVLIIPIRAKSRHSMRAVYREALKALIDTEEPIVMMTMIGCGGYKLDVRSAARDLYEAILTFSSFQNIKELILVDKSRRTIASVFEECSGLRDFELPSLDHSTSPIQQDLNSSNSSDIVVIGGSVPRPVVRNFNPEVVVLGANVPRPVPIQRNEVQYIGETVPLQGPEEDMSKETLSTIYFEVDRTTFGGSQNHPCSVCLNDLITSCGDVDRTTFGGSQNHPCSVCLNDLITSCGDGFEESPLEADPLVQLKLCPHQFHKSCIDKCFKRKKQCPMCMRWYAPSFGTQPLNARMRVKRISGHPPGHPKADGWFKITYTISSGIQTAHHIRPGVPFTGTTRSAYLPNDEEGRLILRLLQKAFEHRHTFTIGDSITSGMKNVPVWVIHHKTSQTGGPQNFGYPDAEFYRRTRSELELLGITPEMLDN